MHTSTVAATSTESVRQFMRKELASIVLSTSGSCRNAHEHEHHKNPSKNCEQIEPQTYPETDLGPTTCFLASTIRTGEITCIKSGVHIGCVHNANDAKWQATEQGDQNRFNEPIFWSCIRANVFHVLGLRVTRLTDKNRSNKWPGIERNMVDKLIRRNAAGEEALLLFAHTINQKK